MKETNPPPYRRAAQSLEKELHFCCKERATCQPAAQGQVLSLDLLGLDPECQPQASAFPAAAMGDGWQTYFAFTLVHAAHGHLVRRGPRRRVGQAFVPGADALTSD